MNVPYGTRSLYISCSGEKQFSGIRQLFQKLSRLPAAHLLYWQGGMLDLAARRVLERVVVSGHGSPGEAGFDASSEQELKPPSLRLPRSTRLYLLGCYQGRQRPAWAAGTGIAPDRVFGCAGETESAVSTCLLLHLLEEGPESIGRWFPVWVRCNNTFRPYFPLLRDTYDRVGEDPLAALAELKARKDLAGLFRDYEEFLAVINRRPAYLTDLR